MLHRRVVADVHDGGADPLADGGGRDEGLPRLGGLPPEDAVRLGRVAARFVGRDPGDLGADDEVHLPLRGLLPVLDGVLHRLRLVDHPAPHLELVHGLPAAGPAVVLVRLLDVPVVLDREEVEEPHARGERPDLRSLRVHEVLVDLLVRLLEVPGGDLELQVLQLPVDVVDLLDLLLHRDVGELLHLGDGPVRDDRLLRSERDRVLPVGRLRDLHGVVDEELHVRLRHRVRRAEPEPALREDPHADPGVLPEVQGVKDGVLQDEALVRLVLVAGLRVRGALLPRVVHRKVDEVQVRHRSPPRVGGGMRGAP